MADGERRDAGGRDGDAWWGAAIDYELQLHNEGPPNVRFEVGNAQTHSFPSSAFDLGWPREEL
jgi:hypothetical protein